MMNLLKRCWILSLSAVCETAGGSRSLRPWGPRATASAPQRPPIPVPCPGLAGGCPGHPPGSALPAGSSAISATTWAGLFETWLWWSRRGLAERRVPHSGSRQGPAAAGKWAGVTRGGLSPEELLCAARTARGGTLQLGRGRI